MGKDLISVIIPVYKVEKYLDRCVESVVNQTYKNLEIILVDDGSPDNCPQMCDEWAKKDKRIKVIHKENGGVSSARNLGLEQATGNYIAFVDSDDWLDLTMYEELVKSATETNADMVFCKIKRVFQNGKVEEFYEKNLCKIKNKEVFYMLIFGSDETIFSVPWRMLVEQSIAKSCSFTTKLKHGEDLFYVLDCIEKSSKIEIVDKFLYNYYYNSTSVTVMNNDNYFRNIRDLYNHQKNYLKKKNLSYNYVICHAYIYRNVTKRLNQKGFVKQMKNLYKIDNCFRECFTKENYKKNQKFEKKFKSKIRNFLVYHRMWFVFKLLAKKPI